MTDKTCNKCGVKGLWWNKKHFEKTGKWQLIDHKDKKCEWCVRNNAPKIDVFDKTSKIILCEYCEDSNFGLCRSTKDYQAHLKAYHSNKEILTNLDYMFGHSNLQGVNLINWKSDPHYEKYKSLIQ